MTSGSHRQEKEPLSRARKAIRKMAAGETLFFKRVMILMSGSVLAQTLPILVAPVLSRLFTPEHMGAWGLYAATTTVCSTVSTLRYENAVMLPDDDADSSALVIMAILSSCVVALVVALAFAVGGETLLEQTGLQKIGNVKAWIPAGILLMAVFQTLGAWHIRVLAFAKLAAARVGLYATVALSQVGLGLFRTGAVGLVVGQTIGQAVGLFIVSREIWSRRERVFQGVHCARIVKTACRYRRFPLLSLPADMAGVLSTFLPLILMGVYFGPQVAGFFALTQKVLTAPASLVGNAVLDVFKERAAADYRALGDCRRIFLKMLLTLSILALPPALALYFFGPQLFAWVFGSAWREAGAYASLLAPLLFVRFVANPLSYTLSISQKQGADLMWQIGLLAVGFAALFAGRGHDSPHFGIMLYAHACSAMYILYVALAFRHTKARGDALLRCSRTDGTPPDFPVP